MEFSNSANQQNPMASTEDRKLSIQRWLHVLMHARKCRNANCYLASCKKMKRTLIHVKMCQRKSTGDCQICRQLIALCWYHARHCQEPRQCPIPFCTSMKIKLKQLNLERKLVNLQKLQQQMAGANEAVADSNVDAQSIQTTQQDGTGEGSNAIADSNMGAHSIQTTQQDDTGEGYNPGNQDSLVRPRMDDGMNLSTMTQKQILRQLVQMVEGPKSLEQKERILTLLKANPQLVDAIIKVHSQQRSVAIGTLGNIPNVVASGVDTGTPQPNPNVPQDNSGVIQPTAIQDANTNFPSTSTLHTSGNSPDVNQPVVPHFPQPIFGQIKIWQISADLRNAVIYRLMQPMFPSLDLSVLVDQGIRQAFTFFHKVENVIYTAANSRPEYFRLAEQERYRIQTGLEMERRRQQLLQQQHGGERQVPQTDMPELEVERVHDWAPPPDTEFTEDDESILECVICNRFKKRCSFKCGHIFCGRCSAVLYNFGQPCPLCRENIDEEPRTLVLS